MAFTLNYFKELKKKKEPISALTAYDSTQTRVAEKAGIEILLVGDSLGMVVQGQNNTLPVKLQDMIYHTKCVSSAINQSFLITDMPFLTYTNPEQALKNAGSLIQKSKAKMVKIEGADPNLLTVIQTLLQNHIPVCGHLGLTPQSILELGKYGVKGQTLDEISALKKNFKDLEAIGVPMVVLECVPHKVAKELTETTSMIVIGIGSGKYCDGQILVNYDLLGLSGKKIKFIRNFLKETNDIASAISAYHQAVKERSFPSTEESYHI